MVSPFNYLDEVRRCVALSHPLLSPNVDPRVTISSLPAQLSRSVYASSETCATERDIPNILYASTHLCLDFLALHREAWVVHNHFCVLLIDCHL